jgi:hypothetical protein
MDELRAAIISGEIHTVQSILDSNPDLLERTWTEKSGRQHMSPLVKACQLGHVHVVTLLIERGARVDQGLRYGRSLWTPLRAAIM